LPPASAQSKTDSAALFISNPVDFPKSIQPVFEVKDKLGNVIFKAIKGSDLLEYNKEQELLKQ
jgi:hypothetical protein